MEISVKLDEVWPIGEREFLTMTNNMMTLRESQTVLWLKSQFSPFPQTAFLNITKHSKVHFIFFVASFLLLVIFLFTFLHRKKLLPLLGHGFSKLICTLDTTNVHCLYTLGTPSPCSLKSWTSANQTEREYEWMKRETKRVINCPKWVEDVEWASLREPNRIRELLTIGQILP